MLNSTMIDSNNRGCQLLQKGQVKAALHCFKGVLSTFRREAQEEVLRRRNAAETGPTVSCFGDVGILPLSESQEAMMQTTLLPLLAASNEDAYGSAKLPIHSQAFPMFEGHTTFSSDSLINDQVHMAVVLFNLALCFHRTARSSATSNTGLSQARALYGHALKILQGLVRSPSATTLSSNAKGLQTAIPSRRNTAASSSGNHFVDLLFLATLNNTAVLCCTDANRQRSQDHHVVDARNAGFVRHFCLLVQAQQRSCEFWLGRDVLHLFERNATALGLLFVRGTAAAAA